MQVVEGMRVSQALRDCVGRDWELVVTPRRKAPSCMALLVPGCRGYCHAGRALLLSEVWPLPMCPGPTQHGLFLGQGMGGECTSEAFGYREKEPGCLMPAS